MRKLLLTLRDRDGKQLPRTFLITSSESGEGKTLAALLLASELARSEKSPVALVDFDLRRPTLHRILQIETNGATVASALAGGNIGPLLPLPLGEGCLSLLPAGAVSEEPSQLLTLDRIRDLLARLLPVYSHVVLDAPPCVPTPDPLLLGKAVDATLFVVRPGTVPRAAVRRGLRLLRSSEDNLLGIVVNDVSEILPYSYYRRAYEKRVTAERDDRDRA
jgi:Mrp family chromosome partitioning ATPase